MKMTAISPIFFIFLYAAPQECVSFVLSIIYFGGIG